MVGYPSPASTDSTAVDFSKKSAFWNGDGASVARSDDFMSEDSFTKQRLQILLSLLNGDGLARICFFDEETSSKDFLHITTTANLVVFVKW